MLSFLFKFLINNLLWCLHTLINSVILNKINNHIHKETSANQWKDTSSVIEWFVNIEEKERSYFMVSDIESFYPSITEQTNNWNIRFWHVINKPITKNIV